jgi:hypothetical protein
MPRPRFNHGYNNDVFVNYSHTDDEPDPSGVRWVTRFETDLETLLRQNSGRAVHVWRDKKLADRFDQEIREQLRNAAVFVQILDSLEASVGDLQETNNPIYLDFPDAHGLQPGEGVRIYVMYSGPRNTTFSVTGRVKDVVPTIPRVRSYTSPTMYILLLVVTACIAALGFFLDKERRNDARLAISAAKEMGSPELVIRGWLELTKGYVVTAWFSLCFLLTSVPARHQFFRPRVPDWLSSLRFY